MAVDLPRLVAACDKDLIYGLINQIAPELEADIDWKLEGRELGRAVQDSVKSSSSAWVKFQQINSLASHGTTATVRSVLYHDRSLRDEFDELACGLETAAVWLALKDDELFEHCLSALHVDQGLNKRSWKAFRARPKKPLTFSFGPDQLARFERLVREAIGISSKFDSPGELETHYFKRTLFPEHTHSRRVLEQVTVFAEARFVTQDAFVESRLQTEVRHKVDSISLIFDQERKELDVVTLGGRQFVEHIANAFFQALSSETPLLEPLLRRKINFDRLLHKPDLSLIDQTRFLRAKVDEIRLQSPSGALCTFDAKAHRDSDLDVYDVARGDFGERSPFERSGWCVVSARIVLFAVPSKPGRKPRARTVDLKANGHTNLREQEDTDLYIADELLVRWGILEPNNDDVEYD
ncbi:MAG: hypothetical protein AAGC70_17500 [Pseudomonadota bacterium]